MKTILLPAFLFISAFAFGQDWLSGSKGNFVSEALDVATDNSGNSIATGYFSGQMNFNDSTVTSVSSFSDAFVIKYNSTGAIQWLRRFGGTLTDRGQKVACDASGNIYVTGYYAGSITFGATTLTSAAASRDVFIVKLSPAGTVLWAKSEGGGGTDTPYAIAIDNTGNVIVTGQFDGSATFGPNTFTSQNNPLTGQPSLDIFVAKYTTAGSPLWSKHGKSKADDNGLAVTTDAAGNIYMTGQYPDTLAFLGQTFNNQVNNAGFVAKILPDGSFGWFRKLGAAQTFANAIRLNTAGEIYTTGNFLGTMLILDNAGTNTLTSPYVKRIFLLKLASANGNYIWGTVQGSDNDVNARALTIDPAQNIYIAGDFRCTFDEYRDNSETGLWNTVGLRDIFVSKFSPSGTMIWNKQSGGRKDDFCYGIANGGNDTPITAGSYENDFFVPTADYSLTNPSSSQYNVVVNGSVFSIVNFPFYRMYGDLSRNCHIGKVHDSSNPPYYFYIPGSSTNAYEEVPANIIPNQDTLDVCGEELIMYDTHIDTVAGPAYTVSWNHPNGVSNPIYYLIYQSQTIIATLSAPDACMLQKDTIVAIVHPLPQMPLLTDDHNFNNANNPYNVIRLCRPDTALVTLTNICQGCSVEITMPSGNTVDGSVPFDVYEHGTHIVTLTNEFDCQRSQPLVVIVDSVIQYDDLGPRIVLVQDTDFNDTVTVCPNELLSLMVVDTLTNPTPDLIPFGHIFVNEQFSSPDAGTQIVSPHIALFSVPATGWYTFNYDVIIGYMNSCAIDTVKYHVVDSFYIELLPNPVPPVAITSDSPLCIGATGYVSVDTVIPGGMWSGSQIIWESTDHDSIRVASPGFYSYSGQVTLGQCTMPYNFGTLVEYKTAPGITMNPADGLICPNASITLTVDSLGTYSWIGPDGSILGTSQSLTVNTGGLYSCEYTDPEGCEFLLEQVQIYEYITPHIDFAPIDVICNGTPVELIPVYNGVAQVEWLAPINSQANTITVTSGGTYVCEITQCGTTITDTVVITESDLVAVITPSAPNLCADGSVTLTAQSGLESYEWEGSFGSNSLTVTAPGTYHLNVINSLGCMDSTSITIGTYPPSQTPDFPDISACQGENLTFTDNSGLATGWYTDSTAAPVFSGNPFIISHIPDSMMIYVAYDQQPCPFSFDSFAIAVTDTVVPSPISGDLTLCEGEELDLSVPYVDSYDYNWSYNNTSFSDTNHTNVPGNVFYTSGTIRLTTSNSCSSETETVQLTIINEQQLVLNMTDGKVCDDEAAYLSALAPFQGTLYWINSGDTLTGNPLVVTPAMWTDPAYTAYGVDNYGCPVLPASLTLNFFDCNPKPPNVITPNGDGTNDFFIIENAELMPDNYIVIVDRWGITIYETTGYKNNFSGSDLSDGVYFYIFYRKGKDGDVPPIHGFFHLYH